MTLELKLTDCAGRVSRAGIPPTASAVADLPRGLRIPARVEVLADGQRTQVRTLPYGRDILAVSARRGQALLRMEEVVHGEARHAMPPPSAGASVLGEAGVVVHGEAAVGGTVTVMWGGVIHIVPVDSGGRWQVSFGAADIPAPEAVLYARAHACAGGAAAAVRLALAMDRVAPPAPRLGRIGWADPARFGAPDAALLLSGWAEPDSRVLVAWGGYRSVERVGADGAWTLRIPAAAMPASGISPVCAAACDAAGNTGPVTVRLVRVGAQDGRPAAVAWAGANGLMRRDAPDVGVDISGTAEPGCDVLVAWGSVARMTAADATGAWKLRFLPTDMPENRDDRLSAAVNGPGCDSQDGELAVVVEAIIPVAAPASLKPN